jgi:hypothetical protein
MHDYGEGWYARETRRVKGILGKSDIAYEFHDDDNDRN